MPTASHTPNPMKAQAGQVDMFVKMTGYSQGWIKGESADHKHKGEIQIESFAWHVRQPYDNATSLASGKREYSPFVFTMRTQSASANLINMSITGEQIKEMIVTCRKAGKEQQEYLIYTIKDGMIVNFESGYLVDDQLAPHDRISVMFRRFECQVKAQNADGTLGGAVMVADDLRAY